MKNITIATTSRADWGMLKLVAEKLQEDSEINLTILTCPGHLVDDTIKEINFDKNSYKVISLLNHALRPKEIDYNYLSGMHQIMLRQLEFIGIPDMLIVLGDRHELIPLTTWALMNKIPIAHICSGEDTFNCYDQSVRNFVTTSASLCFPTCIEYEKRTKQVLGKNPKAKVFNVGDLEIENYDKTGTLSMHDWADLIDVSAGKLCCCYDGITILTYHPTTLDTKYPYVCSFEVICDALEEMNILTVITAPGLDISEDLQYSIDNYCKKDNFIFRQSLGSRLFLQSLQQVTFLIGNSSSNFVLPHYLNIPVINVGNRQNGRIKTKNIINCEPEINPLKKAIKKASNHNFKTITVDHYGDGNTSTLIVKHVKEFLDDNNCSC